MEKSQSAQMSFNPSNPETMDRENQIMAVVADGLSKEQKDSVLNSLSSGAN